VALVTQSMSNNSGAADRRPEGAWGSLPGKVSSPYFFGPILWPQMNTDFNHGFIRS